MIDIPSSTFKSLSTSPLDRDITNGVLLYAIGTELIIYLD